MYLLTEGGVAAFTLFCGMGKKCTKNYNVHSHCSAQTLNLLFSDVPVAVMVLELPTVLRQKTLKSTTLCRTTPILRPCLG